MAAVGFASVNDIACSKLLALPEAVQERVRVGKTTIEEAYRIGRPADRGFEDKDLRKYAKQPQRTTENALAAAKSAEEERAALGPGERGAGGRAEGRSDPRILPFHIFKTKGGFDLDDPPDRRRFRQLHKTRGETTLVDKRERRWSPPRSGAAHGREPQTVRRLRLDDGFHWDVTTRGSADVASANTIWKVPRDAHVNIYPDGYIRSGRRCRQVWTCKQSARADAQERD